MMTKENTISIDNLKKLDLYKDKISVFIDKH